MSDITRVRWSPEMTPHIDVLALAVARMEDAYAHVESLHQRNGARTKAFDAWERAVYNWCRALDFAAELQAADAV